MVGEKELRQSIEELYAEDPIPDLDLDAGPDSGRLVLDADDRADEEDLSRMLGQAGASDQKPVAFAALSATLGERMRLLRDAVSEIKAQMGQRKQIHTRLLKQVGKELFEMDLLLKDVRVWSLGENPSVDSRRTNLEREELSLKKIRWDEQLRRWRDLVALSKELREAIAEYQLVRSAKGIAKETRDKGRKGDG